MTVESESSDTEVDAEVPFVATNEWQPIRPGQVIPAGLHVRINFETGAKEAKILDDNDGVDQKTELIDKHKKVGLLPKRGQSDIHVIGQQIKQVLEESIFSKRVNITDPNFRSIDEIKKEFAEMSVKMESESELLATLIRKYNLSSSEEKQTLLADIEYLVHSIDVARDLVRTGGVPLFVNDLNSTDWRLRAQIAFTLGSAMNANPRVQIEVLQTGALKDLLYMLQSDSSFAVRKKCLFAISCLVRQFPTAQKSLVKEYGGLSILAHIFAQSDIDSVKLSAKVMTLLNDLFIERQTTVKYAASDPLSQIKLKQYQEVELEDAIVSHGFCRLIPSLLESPDFDIKEKTIEAMNSLMSLCKQEFKKSLNVLQTTSRNYAILAKSESNNDSYYSHLYETSLELLKRLESDSRDEL